MRLCSPVRVPKRAMAVTRVGPLFGVERLREALTWDFVARGAPICALNLSREAGRWPIHMYEQATRGPTAMQVRDLTFLNYDFRNALDRCIGAEVCTRLAQLGSCGVRCR